MREPHILVKHICAGRFAPNANSNDHWLMEKLGPIIRQRRKALNMTIEELAHRIGSDVGNVSRIERSKQDVPLAKLEAFAKALGCEIWQLFISLDAERAIYNKNTIPNNLVTEIYEIPLLSSHDVLSALAQGKKDMTGIKHEKRIPVSGACSPFTFAIPVENRQMEGHPAGLNLGSNAIIDPAVRPNPGDIVLAIAGGDLVFGEYHRHAGETMVVPGNRIFSAVKVNSEAVVGVVICSHLDLRRGYDDAEDSGKNTSL